MQDLTSARASSSTLAAAGPLLSPLCLALAVMLGAWGVSNHGMLRIVGVAIGCTSLVVAGVARSVRWERVPPAFMAGLTGATCLSIALLWYVAPLRPVAIASGAVAVLWLALSLEGPSFVGTLVALCLTTALATVLALRGRTNVADLVIAVVMLAVVGVLAHLVQRTVGRAHRDMVEAQRQNADRDLAARQASEALERDRAAQAVDHLTARSRLLHQIHEQAAHLAAAAVAVNEESQLVAASTHEMSTSVDGLSQTAQLTKNISDEVGVKADGANAVMQRLSAASAEIMTASTVIQGIAEQTNLLALNATIEAARAGEAGRGFAVVATEVKDLAQQSGANADRITTTLQDMRALVDQAVEEVSGITAVMMQLRDHNSTLAAAVDEQAATVQEMSRSTQSTAGHVAEMTSGVAQLESICTAAADERPAS